MAIQANRRREARDPYATLGHPTHSLAIIHELALSILQEHSLEDLLWLIAKSIISKLGFEDCIIYLLDEERGVLVQRAAFGPKSPESVLIVDPIEIPVGTGIVGTVARTGKAELVADVRRDRRYIVDDARRISELAVPIMHEQRVIGVIDSEHSEAGFYTNEHLELLTIIASMASTKVAAELTIERLNETVAELEQARRALRREELRYRDFYNKHPSMFFNVSSAGIVLSTNDYACQQLGYTHDEIEGRRFSDLVSMSHERSTEEEIAAALESTRDTRRWEGSIKHKDGLSSWLRLTARGLEFEDGQERSILIVAEDVTETHVLSQELEYNATHDWLTGLYNRREFENRLHDAINKGRRRDDEHVLCFVGLDQFKVINDTCSHAAGDSLLRHISKLFERHVRKSDVVGRVGGDEFGILMMNCRLADARRSANVLLKLISEEPFNWKTHNFSVGASIGLASLRVGVGSVDEVISAADAACLSAKESGRHRVYVYRERDAKRLGQTRWVSRITQALTEDAFRLYYQTIVPLSDVPASPMHAEILLRMVKQDGRVILPGTFIPAAERYGLAVRMDQWVVDHALSQLVEIQECSSTPCTWTINLSGVSVGDPGFLEFVIERLKAAGTVASHVCFEITETAAIADLARARRFIEELKKLGCLFALDDFGSGLSSLAYLKTLPVDFLKIDGVFIKDVNLDPVNHAMVRYINDIGHLMGKKTIAEFVYEDAVLETIRRIGVDFAQGNCISKPRPIEEYA